MKTIRMSLLSLFGFGIVACGGCVSHPEIRANPVAQSVPTVTEILADVDRAIDGGSALHSTRTVVEGSPAIWFRLSLEKGAKLVLPPTAYRWQNPFGRESVSFTHRNVTVDVNVGCLDWSTTVYDNIGHTIVCQPLSLPTQPNPRGSY